MPLSRRPPRILVHAPRGRDAEVVCQVLEAQFARPTVCATLTALLAELGPDADMAFVTEESLAEPELEALAGWVEHQPTWSDFPFIILTSRRSGRRPAHGASAFQVLGNVVLLERPLNAETLLTAARSALRGRARQYETQRHLENQHKLERDREALLIAEREARLEAERAGRMKDEFLATLSHELRTPLSAILGWTHLLRRPNAGNTDIARVADTIERNARAQARLIEELLDVSRITSGKFQLDIRPVSVAEVFRAVVQALQPGADAKGISVVTADVPPIPLQADPGRLQQMVWNLLSNAIKFTPSGGTVTLTAHVEGDEACLMVSDDGTGIAADFLPHVFERFRQAESSEARSFGGLGLGLAIVRQLVELHGGSVAARSDGSGRGATFLLRLPLAGIPDRATVAPAPLASEPVEVPDAPGQLAGVHILIVDDETDGREMLTRMLESRGARVRAAGSADEALALIEASTPDLLISDIGMPRIDGYELLRRIRRQDRPQLRAIPAIALTAFARPGDAARAREVGYAAHLAKPVEPAVLFSTIDGFLHRPGPA